MFFFLTWHCNKSYLQSSGHHMRGSPGHILTNLIINWLLDGNADSERLKTPKTDCVLKVNKVKGFYQLGFVDLENTGEHATLKVTSHMTLSELVQNSSIVLA